MILPSWSYAFMMYIRPSSCVSLLQEDGLDMPRCLLGEFNEASACGAASDSLPSYCQGLSPSTDLSSPHCHSPRLTLCTAHFLPLGSLSQQTDPTGFSTAQEKPRKTAQPSLKMTPVSTPGLAPLGPRTTLSSKAANKSELPNARTPLTKTAVRSPVQPSSRCGEKPFSFWLHAIMIALQAGSN